MEMVDWKKRKRWGFWSGGLTPSAVMEALDVRRAF
jgi:hypothetical protein